MMDWKSFWRSPPVYFFHVSSQEIIETNALNSWLSMSNLLFITNSTVWCIFWVQNSKLLKVKLLKVKLLFQKYLATLFALLSKINCIFNYVLPHYTRETTMGWSPFQRSIFIFIKYHKKTNSTITKKGWNTSWKFNA